MNFTHFVFAKIFLKIWKYLFFIFIIYLLSSSSLTSYPEVISFSINNSSTRIGEYSAKAIGRIRNTGTKGNCVVHVTVSQNGKIWRKTQIIWLNKNETSNFELVFDEVNLDGETPSSKCNTFPSILSSFFLSTGTELLN